MNIAAREADPRAKYLLRADCHADYPEGFAERSIAALRERGAASVVVTMHSQGNGCMQKAIAAASNSRLGNGGSAHRRSGISGYVDHGHHAAFDRETYLALGGYDESFRHNEDAEYDQRVIRSGKRIYLLGDLAIRYFPRAGLGSLCASIPELWLGPGQYVAETPRLAAPAAIASGRDFVGKCGRHRIIAVRTVVSRIAAALCGTLLRLGADSGREGWRRLSGDERSGGHGDAYELGRRLPVEAGRRPPGQQAEPGDFWR